MAAIEFYKRDDHGGFRLSEFYRGRKRACKSTAAAAQQIPLKKRRFPSIESGDTTSDYSEKRRKIEETIALKYTINDVVPCCGSVDVYESPTVISRGSYGVVYRARDTRSGEIVAVKEENDGLCMASLREIEILESLRRHRNVVEFKEVAADDCGGVYVVFEYVEYDLKRYAEVRDLSVEEIKSLMKQLLEGVRFLHESMVMHRDIKPSNILVNERGVLKICDFGLSRRIKATAEVGAAYSPHVGTLPYRAPEMLRGERGYTAAVDMWAVGCTMAEVLLKRVLFSGGRQTASGQLRTVYRILGPPGFESVDRPCNMLRKRFCGGGGGGAPLLTESGFDLLMRLLSYDPSRRITAESALHHAWFQESS